MRHAAFHCVFLRVPLTLAIALGVFGLLGSATSFAQPVATTLAEPAAPLTLATALKLALANNPDIAVARREVEASDGAVMQSSARTNPELSFMQEDTRRATRSSAVQLSMPIERGGKRAARVDASQRGRDVAALELVERQGEVRAAVIAAFFEVLTAQERIRLSQETLSLTQQITLLTGKRVLAGKISPVEETRARVAESLVKVELAQVLGELRVLRQKLSALWGHVAPRFERVDGALEKLPALPTPASLDTRVAQSPALKRAEAEVARRSALSRVEQTKRTQDPTVSLGLKHTPEYSGQLLLGVSIPLALFDNNQGNLLEALRREDKARDEMNAQRLRLQSQVMQARERLLTALTEVDALQNEVLPGAQSAFEAASKGFDAGKFSFIDILDAQRALVQVRTQALRAIAETHRAATDIERALGDNPAEPT